MVFESNAPPLVSNPRFRIGPKKANLQLRPDISSNVEIYQKQRNFLEFSNYQKFIAKIYQNKYYFATFSARAKILVENFFDKIKPVVSEKYEFKKQRVSTLTIFLGKFLLISGLMQRTESTVFQRIKLGQKETFPQRI